MRHHKKYQNHVMHVMPGTTIYIITFLSKIQSRGYPRSRGKRYRARAMEVATVTRDSGHMAVLNTCGGAEPDCSLGLGLKLWR